MIVDGSTPEMIVDGSMPESPLKSTSAILLPASLGALRGMIPKTRMISKGLARANGLYIDVVGRHDQRLPTPLVV
jgi:hypothetical protein